MFSLAERPRDMRGGQESEFCLGECNWSILTFFATWRKFYWVKVLHGFWRIVTFLSASFEKTGANEFIMTKIDKIKEFYKIFPSDLSKRLPSIFRCSVLYA